MISATNLPDIPELTRLINSAYRGEASRNGWTTEADLIEGDYRTDESALAQLIQNPNSVILKYTKENKIAGCVYLEKQNKKLYLGLLSVSPAIQNSGIGKQLLVAAEDYALANHCTTITMTVISAREELINWYKKFGYADTGERKPFPEHEKFGKPKKHLQFIVLEKKLTAAG
ncbi:MAG: GNAT family N-acetyltransferase [Chitinophagaceae bacterium]